MNYLKIINKCLIELNYKKVNTFSELIKNEHEKIKNIINVINSEVCSSYKWNFLLKRKSVTLPAGQGDIPNTVDGKILTLCIDNKQYRYNSNFEKFFTNEQASETYSVFNDKILLPQFGSDKTVDIIYFSNKYVKSSNATEKEVFESADDESVIPMPFVEPLLVYGTCMRLKGNPQHIRFNYWLSMYKDALANLISASSATVQETPSVKLKRF